MLCQEFKDSSRLSRLKTKTSILNGWPGSPPVKNMEFSKHNIFSSIHLSDEYFIVNMLSGNADMLDKIEAQRVIRNEVNDDPNYIEKGYVVDPTEEEKLFRRKYLDFLDTRDTDEIQIFYVPSYICNFNCSYCYQEGYESGIDDHGADVTSAFFSYLRENFQTRKKYVTLFGGEPLPGSENNRKFLKSFIAECNKLNLDLAVVTNGFT